MRRACVIFLNLLIVFSSSRSLAQKSDERLGVVSFLVVSGVRQSSGNSSPVADLASRIASFTPHPDFVVLNGDSTESGSAEEFDRLQESTRQLTAAKVAVYGVPGSRDVSCLAQGHERFVKAFGHAFQSFDVGPAHIILLDSTVPLRNEGHFDRAQLDWLDRDLKRTRPESPILIFAAHPVGMELPGTRLLDNDYDLISRMTGHNVVALFTGDTREDRIVNLNGVSVVSSRSLRDGGALRVTVTPALVSIDRLDFVKNSRPNRIASLLSYSKSKPSILHGGWDDPNIPFLERRRPLVAFAPRAVADNPDKEKGEYRLDSSRWMPLVKDRRDMWSTTFPTAEIPIGIHSVDLRITTSSGIPFMEEILCEVERDFHEATRKWAIDLPEPIQSSPIVANDSLLVSSLDGKLTALATDTGKRRWVFPAKAAFVASPVLSEGVIFIGSVDHTFYAIEANNTTGVAGRLKWRFDTDGPIFSSAACAHGVVCFAEAGKIYGLDTDNGEIKWTVPAVGPFESGVATDGDAFYITGWDNSCTAIDAASGAVKWRTTVGMGLAQTPGRAKPCVGGGRVYCAACDGALHCLDASSGMELWAVRSDPGDDPIGGCPPVICGDQVIVAGEGIKGTVMAFEQVHGARKWHVNTGQRFAGGGICPAPNGRSMAIMAVRGHCSIISNIDGARLWGYELGPGNIYSTPVYDGKMLYTTTMADDVQAINGPGVGK